MGKPMNSIIEEVYNFNKESGLLDKPYDDFLESSFQIEEALEGFPLPSGISIIPEDFTNHKELSREIVGNCITTEAESLSDVERFDKHIDSIIYDIGSIAKLQLTPEQIARGINVVIEANKQKLQCKKDELGKLGKPADFVGPESKLQAILDER